MTILQAKSVLLPQGWARNVAVEIGPDGRIIRVTSASPDTVADHSLDILLPAPANVHSHAFQRAMAGLSERRGTQGHDSFWTWRQLMFRFLDHLTPEDVQAITAHVQMEMLESGFAAVGEFHYLHHRPGGAPYHDIAEMSSRIAAAAEQTGIGLTLLPVFYHQGGVDGRALDAGQIRFGNDIDQFLTLHREAEKSLSHLPKDTIIGAAPHSLRAVSPEGLQQISTQTHGPLHLHLAEQKAEVDEIITAYGARPVEWLLHNHPPDNRWCLIHCTQMHPNETTALAATGAVAGLCPITEGSLGDGIFDGARWSKSGGKIAFGSDSNIRISLPEELRQLEYSQRLRDHARAVLASSQKSTGRFLYDAACNGGAQAMGRPAGTIEVGQFGDLVALNGDAPDLTGRQGDLLLDTWIFAQPAQLVSDVWSAGRHTVHDGRHIARDQIIARYRACLSRLRDVL